MIIDTSRRASFAACAMVLLILLVLSLGLGLISPDDAMAWPTLPDSPVTGSLAQGNVDVYDIDFAHQDYAEYYFRCWIYGPDGSRINVKLTKGGDAMAGCTVQAYPDGFSFTPPAGYSASQPPVTDTYQIRITCEEGPGDYTFYWEIRNRDEGLIERIVGQDRIQTSVLCSQKGFPHGAAIVVVATGYNWPDALSASGLAGCVRAPLLLTHASYLDSAILDEIRRLGAKQAYVVGGTGAVSAATFTTLQKELGTSAVTRVAGNDRYSTSAAIAREMKAFMQSHGRSISDTAYITTGANYPDALAIGPIAAAVASPVILEPPSGGLSDATRGLVTELGIKSAIGLGGTGVVSNEKLDDLYLMLGDGHVGRLGGASRYETAAKIAEYGAAIGLNPDACAIVNGTGYPDALSAAMMQATGGSLLLLAPPNGRLGDSAHDFLADIGPEETTHARIVGGFGGLLLEQEICQALVGQ